MAYFSLSNGNDFFQAGNESDWIDAFDGDDIVFGGSGEDTIYGGNGNDAIEGNANSDWIFGGAGNDWLTPNTGAYHYLNGGSGTDTVSFADQNGISVDLSSADANGMVTAYHFAFPSNRTHLVEIEDIYGSEGNDVIIGNDQNNQIWGAGGLDILSGGQGDDTIDPGLGAGLADGGRGTDTLNLHSLSANVDVDLNRAYTNEYDGSLSYFDGLTTITQGLRRFENIDGSNYNDRIAGNHDANVLKGAGGDDEILGRGGHDNLVGGFGSDSLRGGVGDDILNGYGSDPVYEHDVLTGGNGDDTFVVGHSFSIFRNNSFATITDFGQGDKIELRGSRRDYSLVEDNNGTSIYFGGTNNGHAIAYVRGVSDLSLTNSNQFTFTG